jgi:hypothetical protein
MPKEPATPSVPIAEIADRARLREAIARAVLRALGQPEGLRGVDVRFLWDNRYRVNVLIGGDATTVKIAHSYYLQTDSEGGILTATPALTRKYGVEGGGAG